MPWPSCVYIFCSSSAFFLNSSAFCKFSGIPSPFLSIECSVLVSCCFDELSNTIHHTRLWMISLTTFFKIGGCLLPTTSNFSCSVIFLSLINRRPYWKQLLG
uniref:Uncharacterized protein n=1 Tax=Cacopsylla melanoneura TaxID=428564 RepID=A0A8D9A2C5_9HEMI